MVVHYIEYLANSGLRFRFTQLYDKLDEQIRDIAFTEYDLSQRIKNRLKTYETDRMKK